MVTNEPTSSYDTGEAYEASASAGQRRGLVIANAKNRQSEKRTQRQERIREESNHACWEKEWVADLPRDPVELEKILKQCRDLEGVDWPRFHHSQKGLVTAAAQRHGIILPTDTFVLENKKTTLTEFTYAPTKLAAQRSLPTSKVTRRDNQQHLVKILHTKNESGNVDIYAHYGRDHGGEMDVYAGRQRVIPCIGLADPDTGLIFEWSTPKGERYLE